MTEFENRFALGFSRAVTRRRFLQRTMKWAAASALATSASLTWPRASYANHARCNTRSDNWGCYCAGTRSCGSDRCCGHQDDRCCNGAHARCNYWTQRPYCWCSRTCCLGGAYGYYSCCDCWKYGNYGSCNSGNTSCVCKGYVFIRQCRSGATDGYREQSQGSLEVPDYLDMVPHTGIPGDPFGCKSMTNPLGICKPEEPYIPPPDLGCQKSVTNPLGICPP